jgi:hypothetical protein
MRRPRLYRKAEVLEPLSHYIMYSAVADVALMFYTLSYLY